MVTAGNEEYHAGVRHPEPEQQPHAARPPQRDVQLLRDLGVSTREVRKWAEEQGLIPPGERGRIAATVIEAYAEANQ